MEEKETKQQIIQENGEQIREMRLGSGEVVVDRIDSHLHNNAKELIHEVLKKVDSEGRDFFTVEVDLGRIVGEKALVETRAEDIIVYGQRPNRRGFTRFVKNREAEPCTCVVVALEKNKHNSGEPMSYTLLTAYVGRDTPMEPWSDFSKKANPEVEQALAREFWDTHALVYGKEPILPGIETDICPWDLSK